MKIIADSCCDLTPDLRDELGIVSIPLTMMLGDKEFCDDGYLDMSGFMDEMKNNTSKVGSASPPPYLFQEAIENAEDAFIVTLSSKLSGSYENAVIGNKMAMEDGKGAAYVFDSKSASAGETLIAVKLNELIRDGKAKDEIIKMVNRFINDMKTYFVLENNDNLQNNGRLSKVKGSLLRILDIKLIMGADGNGEIALFEMCKWTEQMLRKLLALIESSGKGTQNGNIVIAHVNNQSLAECLRTLIKERFNFKKIFIVPTGGLSSMYADDKGIVLAF